MACSKEKVLIFSLKILKRQTSSKIAPQAYLSETLSNSISIYTVLY